MTARHKLDEYEHVFTKEVHCRADVHNVQNNVDRLQTCQKLRPKTANDGMGEHHRDVDTADRSQNASSFREDKWRTKSARL